MHKQKSNFVEMQDDMKKLNSFLVQMWPHIQESLARTVAICHNYALEWAAQSGHIRGIHLFFACCKQCSQVMT